MSNWKEKYEKLLLKATEYSGSKAVGQRKISASSINKEDYQLMIQYKFEKNKQEKYGANTTGSLYQLGVDKAIEMFGKDDYLYAQRLELELPNGWIISGEYDVYDKKENIVIDNKVISDYSYKDVMKNNPDSDYNLQVATYSMLMYRNNEAETPPAGALAIVNKGGSAVKNNIHTILELFMHDHETIYQMFLEKTNRLQHYIDTDTMPEEICDVNKYGLDKGVPKRCMTYCDYNSVCPHYNKNKSFNERKFMSNLTSDVAKQKEEYIKPLEF